MLPILERLLYKPKSQPVSRVLVLLPTRELAVQVHQVSKQLSQYTKVTTALAAGLCSTVFITDMMMIYTYKFKLSFTHFSFRDEISIFILAFLGFVQYKICQNRVKLATSASKNGEN